VSSNCNKLGEGWIMYTEFLNDAFEGDKRTGIRRRRWGVIIKQGFKARVFSRFTWLTKRSSCRVLLHQKFATP